MGLPIKHRKKYISHKKKWDKTTIDEERVLVNDYALKNKKEIRKIELQIGKYKKIAKELNKDDESKASEQANHFLESLKAKGYLNIDATSLDDVLDIGFRDILERRLSNVLYKNKLARTPSQARQFIVHRHVSINGEVIDSPSYPVTLKGETTIEFRGTSSLASEEHPERKLAIGGLQEEIQEMSDLKDKKKETLSETVQESDYDKQEAELDDEETVEVAK